MANVVRESVVNAVCCLLSGLFMPGKTVSGNREWTTLQSTSLDVASKDAIRAVVVNSLGHREASDQSVRMNPYLVPTETR